MSARLVVYLGGAPEADEERLPAWRLASYLPFDAIYASFQDEAAIYSRLAEDLAAGRSVLLVTNNPLPTEVLRAHGEGVVVLRQRLAHAWIRLTGEDLIQPDLPAILNHAGP